MGLLAALANRYKSSTWERWRNKDSQRSAVSILHQPRWTRNTQAPERVQQQVDSFVWLVVKGLACKL